MKLLIIFNKNIEISPENNNLTVKQKCSKAAVMKNDGFPRAFMALCTTA